MESRVLVGCIGLVLALDAGAAQVFKCVAGGATSYQSMPCARAEDMVPLQIAGAAAPDLRAVPTPASVSQRPRRGPWTQTAIGVGVSDDFVLNMPGWGRPARITRARVAGGWEEVWRYGDSYSGERELRFLNARVVDIVETPAAQASAVAR